MNTTHTGVQGQQQHDVKRAQAHQRACTRGLLALVLLSLWALTLVTGLLLALSPVGPRAGQLLLGVLSRGSLRELHLWLAVLSSSLVLVHIVFEWRVLLACLRHLRGEERTPPQCLAGRFRGR